MSAVVDALDIPFGVALVLAVLVWAAGRVVVAVIDAWSLGRYTDRAGELVDQVERVAAAAGDSFAELESIGKDVGAIRDSVEQLGDPHGGSR